MRVIVEVKIEQACLPVFLGSVRLRRTWHFARPACGECHAAERLSTAIYSEGCSGSCYSEQPCLPIIPFLQLDGLSFLERRFTVCVADAFEEQLR